MRLGVEVAAVRGSTQRGENLDPRDWRRAALCLHVNGDWTEVPNGPGQEWVKRRELAVCAVCPVRDPCAEAGLDEPGGVWGGLLPIDRRRLKRRRAGRYDIRCGTVAGFSAHRRRNEGPCEDCRKAWNRDTQRRKGLAKTRRTR